MLDIECGTVNLRPNLYMSRRKPLSASEKQVKILEIFTETKDIFNLKEIEKIASRDKGVTLNTVKEILDMMVDDGLVVSEKIGTSNYFWAFPSASLVKLEQRYTTLTNELETLSEGIEKVKQQIEEASKERVQCAERDQVIQDLAKSRALETELLSKLQVYSDCNPIMLKEKGLFDIDSKNCRRKRPEIMRIVGQTV